MFNDPNQPPQPKRPIEGEQQYAMDFFFGGANKQSAPIIASSGAQDSSFFARSNLDSQPEIGKASPGPDQLYASVQKPQEPQPTLPHPHDAPTAKEPVANGQNEPNQEIEKNQEISQEKEA